MPRTRHSHRGPGPRPVSRAACWVLRTCGGGERRHSSLPWASLCLPSPLSLPDLPTPALPPTTSPSTSSHHPWQKPGGFLPPCGFRSEGSRFFREGSSDRVSRRWAGGRGVSHLYGAGLGNQHVKAWSPLRPMSEGAAEDNVTGRTTKMD